MENHFESRYAVSPVEAKTMDTTTLRSNFLISSIFEADQVNLTLSHFDRYIVGGAMPVNGKLSLPNPDDLKAPYFLHRREIGMINVGGDAIVTADGVVYPLAYKEALYIGKETAEVTFESADAANPAKLYINSAPAHHKFPTKKVTKAEADIVELGSMETANHRIINKLIVNSVLETCQLQMGMTELKTGSVWNTMPAHTHDRRMEAYFYFDVAADQRVFHLMGQPQETRHVLMGNHDAIVSPPWSIHSGSGTQNYSFIWGMGGENLDYADMDPVAIQDIR